MSQNHEPFGFSWAIRDWLFATMTCFIGIAICLFVLVQVKQQQGISAGALVFQIQWDPAIDADVDLWVKAPDDPQVGYSHHNGLYCNLVRDDLGKSEDPQSNNSEITVCRSAAPGHWAVDAMAYHSVDSRFPISVTLKVTQIKANSAQDILTKTIHLMRQGDIQTFYQFDIDASGKLVKDSVNHEQVDLYKDRPT